jgi:hypothetical protein
MSFDYNILTLDTNGNPVGACNHSISFERYVVDTGDFRTLHYLGNPAINMRAPINGFSTVQMWVSEKPVVQSDPVYGWQIVKDADRVDTTTGDVFYKILFNNPVRIILPLIEVSYTTLQSYCLKCSGLGSLNDLKPSVSGDFQQATQTTKLVQKSLKWVLSSTCAFYPTFTCAIKSYIGRKLGIQITETDIQTQVLNALTQMQQVQNAQGTVQSLDPAEILKDVVNASVDLNPNDPTAVQVSVTVSSFLGISAPLGFTLRMNQ